MFSCLLQLICPAFLSSPPHLPRGFSGPSFLISPHFPAPDLPLLLFFPKGGTPGWVLFYHLMLRIRACQRYVEEGRGLHFYALCNRLLKSLLFSSGGGLCTWSVWTWITSTWACTWMSGGLGSRQCDMLNTGYIFLFLILVKLKNFCHLTFLFVYLGGSVAVVNITNTTLLGQTFGNFVFDV